MIPVFLGITLVTFFIIHLAPGSPSDLLAEAGPRVSYEARQGLRSFTALTSPYIFNICDGLKDLWSLISAVLSGMKGR